MADIVENEVKGKRGENRAKCVMREMVMGCTKSKEVIFYFIFLRF